MRATVRIISVVAIVLLTGCARLTETASFGYLKDRRADYIQAEIYPDLYLPEPMERRAASTYYDLPEGQFAKPSEPVSVIPPDYGA